MSSHGWHSQHLPRPTAGEATVAGYDIVRQPVEVRRRIGYVSQTGGTFSGARAGDEAMDHGMLYDRSRQQVERRGRELFAEFQLVDLSDRTPTARSSRSADRSAITCINRAASGTDRGDDVVDLSSPGRERDRSARRWDS